MFADELHLLSPVHPLQPFIQRSGFCGGLRDPAGNRITLTYPGGNMYRISIPLISECPFVTRCLMALRQVLRKELVVNVILDTLYFLSEQIINKKIFNFSFLQNGMVYVMLPVHKI